MKIMLVNGSPRQKGATNKVFEILKEELEINAVEAEIFWIGNSETRGCIGCMKCKESKRCVFQDKVNEFLDKLEECDGVVFASPVHFSAISGNLSCFMDRAFFIKKDLFANKIASAIAVQRREGGISAIDEMNKYFMMSNMLIATSTYWNSIYGPTAEDVLKDEEGIATIQNLAKNIAYISKAINIARKNGVDAPSNYAIKKTNFNK